MTEIKFYECDCDKCSSMCKGPCCGLHEDMNALIDAGYANRLMLDEWSDGEDMLKPALKGHEGKTSPFETRSEEGCTFWKNGKCELHAQGLKPYQGKTSIHDETEESFFKNIDIIKNSWNETEASGVIEKWKKIQRIT